MSLMEALDGIVHAGFQTVEFCLEHPQASCSTLEYARRIGLEISAVSYHGKRDDHLSRLENGKRALRLAVECSVPIVVLGSPQTGRERFLVESAEMYEMCQRFGVKPAWETEPGTILDGIDQFNRYISPLGPGAGINLDAGHLHLQNSCTVEDITSLGNRIFHVHVEGMNRCEHIHLIPGEGDMNWSLLFLGLTKSGYSGSLTIDLFVLPKDWRKYLKDAYIALNRLVYLM